MYSAHGDAQALVDLGDGHAHPGEVFQRAIARKDDPLVVVDAEHFPGHLHEVDDLHSRRCSAPGVVSALRVEDLIRN